MRDLDFSLPGAKSGVLSEQIATLSRRTLAEKLNKARRSIAKKEVAMEQLWSGLRKEEFEGHRKRIQLLIPELENVVSEYQLSKPKDWENASWKKLVREIQILREERKKAKADTQKHLTGKEKKLANLKTQSEDLSRRLGLARERSRDIETELSQWLAAEQRMLALASAGLIKMPAAIELESLIGLLNDLIQKAEAFSEEMLSQIKAREQKTALEERLEKKLANQKELNQLVKAANELVNRFQALTKPEIFEEEKWDRYGDTISAMFKKLHWPQDYKEVRLSRCRGMLDVEVTRRESPDKLISAHKQLSAGQRAALAISVFWAFNAIPENVPHVLLMDEPIQSIDDLNILTFLDGLRWLTEAVDRQIFLTTANQRVSGLIRRKFSYLEDDFLELRLVRDEGLSRLEYWNWKGKRMGKQADSFAALEIT